MADTFWASGLWSTGFWADGLWSGAAAPDVPDVVGQTQADGTLTLEGDGFVVVVVTAASSTVAAGLIISQDPVGGSTAAPGSTVTITVSTGDDPALDVRLAAKRPNVRMRRLSEILTKPPPPAEITNMPDAPKTVPGAVEIALAIGIESPPAPAPAEVKVDVAQRKSTVADTPPTGDAGSTPAVGATPAAAPAPASPAAMTREDLVEAFTAVLKAAAPLSAPASTELPIKMMEGLNTVLGVQVDKLLAVFGSLVTEISSVRSEIAAERKSRELEARNRARAEELRKKLLDD